MGKCGEIPSKWRFRVGNIIKLNGFSSQPRTGGYGGKNDDHPLDKCEAFDPKCEVTTILWNHKKNNYVVTM